VKAFLKSPHARMGGHLCVACRTCFTCGSVRATGFGRALTSLRLRSVATASLRSAPLVRSRRPPSPLFAASCPSLRFAAACRRHGSFFQQQDEQEEDQQVRWGAQRWFLTSPEDKASHARLGPDPRGPGEARAKPFHGTQIRPGIAGVRTILLHGVRVSSDTGHERANERWRSTCARWTQWLRASPELYSAESPTHSVLPFSLLRLYVMLPVAPSCPVVISRPTRCWTIT
jgi:hypothetical protein